MRDLGQQKFSDFARPSKTKTIFRILILLIIVGAILYFAKSRLNFGQIGSGSVILREAPRGLKPVVVDQTAELSFQPNRRPLRMLDTAVRSRQLLPVRLAEIFIFFRLMLPYLIPIIHI